MDPLDAFLPVPVGEFLAGPTATPQTLGTPFWIAHTPVTRQQYVRFVDHGGYIESRWWDPTAWQLCTTKAWQAPYGWNDEDTPDDPLLPVVGVSWYEARAYCRWLDAQLREAHWPGLEAVPENYHLRLPTALEWERAARGTDGRRYPWGDELLPERANMGAHGVGRISQVTANPQGVSPVGALDMVGNVWEWVLDPAEGDSRATRGGSWFDLPEVANCWGQGQLRPNARNFPMWGFRVVLAAPHDWDAPV